MSPLLWRIDARCPPGGTGRRQEAFGRTAGVAVLWHNILVSERPKATTRPGKPNQPQPPTGRPTSGKVIRIHAGQSHGFIRDENSREVFFHRSDTTFGTFNKLLVGDKVAFDLIEDRVSGPRATAVRLGKNGRS